MNKQKVGLYAIKLCFLLFHSFAFVQVTQATRLSDSRSEQGWREIQGSVKDTVVQVFSYIAAIDLLEPYKTPHQKAATGTGFFIDDQGHIITNAHVVDQAVDIRITIPSLGKKYIKVNLISICHDYDIALLQVSDEDRALIRAQIEKIPFLPLGNSDLVCRADEVMALGYPLGQHSLKSTTGVISGREQDMIQMSAPINPGSSGGPLLNMKGEVVGINAAGVVGAQNVGYIIPINRLKLLLPDMKTFQLVKRPFIGAVMIHATDALTDYLGNPQPGGCYIVEVIQGSPMDKAGIKAGDMIYKVDGNSVDIYGEMKVDWSEDRVFVADYVYRLKLGEEISVVVYRNGERLEFQLKIDQMRLEGIRKIYPGYEAIDYEVFGGMVVMSLTVNHLSLLAKKAPGLFEFCKSHKQHDTVLIITHIFQSSELFRSRTMMPGFTLNEVNGVEVKTLDDFRAAVLKGKKDNRLVLRASNNVTITSDNVLVVLPLNKIVEQEQMLSQIYRYPLSSLVDLVVQS